MAAIQDSLSLRKVIVTLIVALMATIGMVVLPAVAATEFEVQNAPEQPASTSTTANGFTPKVASTGYVEATNSFDDGNPDYYLLTQDPAKAGLTEVTHKGVEYDLTGVAVVGPDYNGNTLTFTKVDGSGQSVPLLRSGAAAQNFTIFIDEGSYNDTFANNYTSFSKSNASFVGLNPDARPVLSRSARSDNGELERFLIISPNVYFEDVVFDGRNIELMKAYTSPSNLRNRGEHLIHVNGSHTKNTDGFVM